MNVTLPDSLKIFVEQQVSSGRYANPDAFVADLVKSESEVFERVRRGEPLPLDEHFDRRLETLLDEAADSDYVEVTRADFNAMEREALELVRKTKVAVKDGTSHSAHRRPAGFHHPLRIFAGERRHGGGHAFP